MTELPDLPKQQAAMVHSLPIAVGLRVRTFKGWPPAPSTPHWHTVTGWLTGCQGLMPLTAHQSLLSSPGSIPPQPPRTMLDLGPCPTLEEESPRPPQSSFSLALPPTLSQKTPSVSTQDNPPCLWQPQCPPATTATALPATTQKLSTEIRGLPMNPIFPRALHTSVHGMGVRQFLKV